MPIVEAMLKNTGLTVQDCDAVAVAAGPGSFTGIRIGVSAAKGLAFAADKPCAAVSTLEAMARNVATWTPGGLRHGRPAQPDLQRPLHLRTWPPDPPDAGSRHRLAELAEELRSEPLPLVIVGDGAVLCEKALTESGLPCRLAPPQLVMQNAMSVACAPRTWPGRESWSPPRNCFRSISASPGPASAAAAPDLRERFRS